MADPARIFFRNPFYDGQLARTLAAATVGAADLGEALATARRVGRATGDAWYGAWSATATTAEEAGRTARLRGDRVGAGRAFLRASEYHRQSFFFIRSDLDDVRLQDGYRRHVAAFRDAVADLDTMGVAGGPVAIPYEDIELGAYLFTPAGQNRRWPTLVIPAGYDSTAEAGWANVPPAVARGYAVLLVEGPGQGGVLYRNRRYFRPDAEQVLTPMLDWLLDRPEVDPSGVVLVGRSFGGYLAPRAAAFDHRWAALVCDPPQPDMGAHLPGGIIGRVAAPVAAAQARLSAGRSEFFGARMASHGLTDIGAYFDEIRRFTMLDHAGAITCPTLLVESEHDFAGGGSAPLAAAMTAPATRISLTARAGADGHCAGLGQDIWSDAVYGWLAQTLGTTTQTTGWAGGPTAVVTGAP